VARHFAAALTHVLQGAIEFRSSRKLHPILGEPQPRCPIDRVSRLFCVAPAILGFAAVPRYFELQLHDTSIPKVDETVFGRSLERFGSRFANFLCHGNG
jgi:hypothetical protein